MERDDSPLKSHSMYGSYEQDKMRSSNGYIVSAVTFSTILAIAVAIVLKFGRLQYVEYQADLVVWILIDVFRMVSFFCVVVLFYIVNRRECVHQFQCRSRKLSSTLKLAFLWIFGLGVCLQDAMDLLTSIECIDKGSKTLSLSIASSAFKIIYTCFQLTFVTYAVSFQFKVCTKIEFLFSVVIMENLVHWFNINVKDIYGIYYPPSVNTTRYLNTSQNTLYTPEYFHCIWDSSIQRLMVKLLPYFIPLRLEFTLLIVEFLFRIRKSKQMWKNHRPAELYTPSAERRYVSQARPLPIAFGIIHNLPLLIFTMALFLVHKDESWALHMPRLSSKIFQTIIIFISVAKGFHLLSGLQTSIYTDNNIYIEDKLLIAGASGLCAYYTVGCISHLYADCELGSMVFFSDLSAILVAHFQTIFILSSKRHKIIDDQYYRSICIILAISNFTIWFQDSFFGLRGMALNSAEQNLVGKETWAVMKHLMFPFVIFYRYQCSCELFDLSFSK